MTQEQFYASLEATFKRGLEIIHLKNADYANSANPFRNFESASIAGLGVERAILVRVLDKLSRVSNLLSKDPAVVEETVNDTILDAINYLAIMKAYIEACNLEAGLEIRQSNEKTT
jgi:hypothetical protein